jgi:nucleoside-diphosphate-sugar epimerase
MKKALATGAAGFIRSHVARELLSRNVEVRCLLYPGESSRNLGGLDVDDHRRDHLHILSKG